MNHYPFDGGALAELGALTGQKTIKAACGKRVPFAADAHQRHVDCPNCRAWLSKWAVEHRAIASGEVPLGCTTEQLAQEIRSTAGNTALLLESILSL